MSYPEIDWTFKEWVKEFIPKEDNRNDCEILNIKMSYRTCNFTYMTKSGEEKEGSCNIDLW